MQKSRSFGAIGDLSISFSLPRRRKKKVEDFQIPPSPQTLTDDSQSVDSLDFLEDTKVT